ncbi:hypothetical protein [Serratia microhaemolytica]|uniref:hypothetical protein n=1 Tax=Serratia microhaemolytica TaxID=2675110 RepID=UPI000FDEF2AD|nr:hypothetical protein [Serratia microhaemolytica]
MGWSPSNPVERRLVRVDDDWIAFAADKSARLLYWQVNQQDLPLLHTYFQIQCENASAVIALHSSITSAEITHYPQQLTQELYHFYQQRREPSRQQGINADWQLPEREEKQSPFAYFWQAVTSMMQQHPDIFPALVLVLQPVEVKQPEQLSSILAQLLMHLQAHPQQAASIRMVLYGDQPEWVAEVKQQFPERVQIIQRDYGMQSVPRELIATSSERGASGNFRRLFIELSETLVNNDAARLEKLKAAALQITQSEKWFDQSVVVLLISGAAYLKWQQPDRALHEYQQATEAGKQAVAAQHPAGDKLVANALFGQASVHLSEKAYAKAAACYAEAAQHSALAEDAILTVEAWRMNAFCQQKEGETELQINAGLAALEAGQQLDPATRTASSLPMAAQALLTASAGWHWRRQREQAEQRLHALFGENWQQQLDATTGGNA